jgi:hypothetical protein
VAAATLAFGACASISGLSAFSDKCTDNCGDATTSSSSGGHADGSSIDSTVGDDGTGPDSPAAGDDGGDASTCPGAMISCNGVCIDPSSTANCGACGRACSGSTPYCSAPDGMYTCTASCPATQPVACPSGTCVDVTTDPANCAGCSMQCVTAVAHAHPTCSSSTCGFACDPGYNLCNGACVDFTSATSCGGCPGDGGTHVCSGATPVCAAGDGGAYACSNGCPPGQKLCGGTCVDTTSTATSCGGCASGDGGAFVCKTNDPNGEPVCVNSSCTVSCNTGYTLCGSSCAALDTNSNCGFCGVACSAEAGTPVCSATGGDGGGPGCVSGCPSGQSFCGGACVDKQTDPLNCGTSSCGNKCTTNVANAHVTCAAGACGFACNTNYTLCNGACVNITNDKNNCGTCGHACTGATPVCSSSACVTGCPAGQANCSGSCVDETSDPNNCNGCGLKCTTGVSNAHAACQSSACTFACNTNYTACNGACVNEQTDKNNCGGCGSGHVCASGLSCSAGVCTCVASGCPGCACILGGPCCNSNNTCGCQGILCAGCH